MITSFIAGNVIGSLLDDGLSNSLAVQTLRGGTLACGLNFDGHNRFQNNLSKVLTGVVQLLAGVSLASLLENSLNSAPFTAGTPYLLTKTKD